MEVSCRRMSLFLKDTHESHDSIRKPLVENRQPRARTHPSRLQRASNCGPVRTAYAPPQSCARLTSFVQLSCIRQAHCTTSHTSDRPRRSRHRPPAPPPATGRNCTARYVL